jgi:phosphoglycerol transferase MdoB-like AlkP superfamily enzyme
MPWGGLALGTTGFFIAHQLGSSATFQDCRVGSPWVVIFGTIVGLALIVLGAIESWRVYADCDEGAPRRTVAVVSVMASALFALGAVLPLIAALVIPGCWE